MRKSKKKRVYKRKVEKIHTYIRNHLVAIQVQKNYYMTIG
ncbi:hypothetical protein HMPREF0373_01138 [Eubacterium ramulus ATCC 29099]|uniref:Uncharacterized protein n=1 Tax=Eubacterium ramulus ATCC 29099 TaxID=1256908 RepID=U2PZE1_EUBRA|nr:hypothetical protein HMPREF0373_01138 [Eubacterium ramulus ATCC 29099]